MENCFHLVHRNETKLKTFLKNLHCRVISWIIFSVLIFHSLLTHTQSSCTFIDVNTHHFHILFKVSPAMGKLEKERKEQTMQSQESVFDFSFSLKDY